MVSYSKDYALTSSSANLTTSYQYDYTDKGNLSKLTMTSGNATYTYTPSYDALDRVYSSAAVMTTASGSLTNTLTYDFTVGSNSNESLQVSQYTSQFGSNNVSYNYTYDANGNITKITLSTGAEYRYVYDDIGQLIREDNPTLNRTYVYSYDDAGNILSKKTYALTAAGSTPSTLYSTYSYGYTDSWGDLLTAYRGVSFTYDEIGNPLTYYNGSSYTFTWENGRRLKTATVGSNTLSFTYNHDGIRTSKTVNGVVHNYTVSDSLILTEEWGTNLVVYLYDANGEPIGMRYRTSSMAEGVFYTFWFDKNLQGDVVAVYNETGTKVLSYTYDAWGDKTTTVHNSSGSNSYAQYNAITYRGYYYDAETCLYYLQARYYDPIIGRFINADSFVSTGQGLIGSNMYVYCGNNPVVRKDDCGKFWDTVFDVVSLVTSVVDVAANPKDPWAWAGLVGDVVDLIPFVSGVGETTKIVKNTIRAVDKFGGLSRAKEFGITSYKALKKALKGTGLQAHHIIEKRLIKHLGINANDMLSVAVTAAEHQKFTNAWRSVFKYGTNYSVLTKNDIWKAAQEIYKDFPELLQAARKTLFG